MYRKRILARENVVTFIYYENISKNCTDPQVTKLIEAGQSQKFKYFKEFLKEGLQSERLLLSIFEQLKK